MPKFNFNNIRNNASQNTVPAPDAGSQNAFSDNVVTNVTAAEQVPISVGAGLLNEASKGAAVDLGNIIYVQRGQLFESADNFYSIDGIDELMESIAACGLLQPLLLKETESGFLVLGGHRRLAAIDRLIAEGRWNREIPGILQNMDKPVTINGIELDDSQKEKYLLITQNKTSRKYTAADTSKEIKVLREILYGNDAAPETEKPAAETPEREKPAKQKRRKRGSGRTRTQIAKELGISEGKVGQHDYVEKHGTEELKTALEEGNVSAPVAAKIAKLDEESQKELLEGADGGEIKAADVRQYMEAKMDPNSRLINRERLLFDLRDVLDLLKNPVTLDDIGMQAYLDCLDLLKDTLNGTEKTENEFE